MADIFERASRLAIRFVTRVGTLCVEDLWGLPLQSDKGRVNLDEIGLALQAQLKIDGKSLVAPEQKVDEVLQLSFDIIKHVIDVKIAERTAAKDSRDRAAKKQQLLSIIADRENDELRGKPLEDLKKALAEL